MKYLRVIIGLIIVVAIVVGAKNFLKKKQDEIKNLPTPKEEIVNINVVKASSGKVEKKMGFLATVEADKEIAITTKLAGYINKIYAKESKSVKKGELLVEIDSKEILSNITSLKSLLNSQIADYKTAEKIYQRNQKLYRVGGLALEKLELSKIAVDMKKSALNSTKSKIAQLKNQLNYLNIKSPIDGIVDVILLHEGDLAPTGKPILKISSLDKKLIFSFAPKYKSSIINRDVLYKGKVIGKVGKIYNSAKNSLLVAEVKLDKKLDLTNNTNIDIEVLVNSKEGCVVPNNAIIHKKSGTYVMLYKQNRFISKSVNLILEDENRAIIKPCPNGLIAVGRENFLTTLPTLGKVNIGNRK